MIGSIRGTLLEKHSPELLVDVGGVGYELLAPLTTFIQLPELGGQVQLYTHLVVREDAHTLYGFASQRERSLFRELIKVNGVGPKLALTILSGIDADEFAQLVRDGDTKALVRLPGIGKKTAERLLIEMRDRLAQWQGDTAIAAPATVGTQPRNARLAEAESALVALGYKPQEASRMVAAVDGEAITSSEELIRLALRGTIKP